MNITNVAAIPNAIQYKNISTNIKEILGTLIDDLPDEFNGDSSN